LSAAAPDAGAVDTNDAGVAGGAKVPDVGTDCAPDHTANAMNAAQRLPNQNIGFLNMTLSRLSESQRCKFRAAPRDAGTPLES
jgi:hypothetical protein